MANLKEVKGRIKSVQSTQQITRAMKMVAAAKLRRAQDRIMQMRPYAEKLNAILQNVSASVDESLEIPYREVRANEKVLLVAVTSDRGLAGPFNTNIFRKIRVLSTEDYSEQASQGNLHVLVIGQKAAQYYAKRELKVVDNFAGLVGNLNFDDARKAAEYIMNAFVNKEYDEVRIVYNSFKNVATQIVRNEAFLPLVASDEADNSKVQVATADYIYEPTKETIVEELVPKSLKVQLYKALLDSAASEHGARMTAMDKATDNAGELLKELKLMYNRTRQAAITTEILEIVSGANALDG